MKRTKKQTEFEEEDMSAPVPENRRSFKISWFIIKYVMIAIIACTSAVYAANFIISAKSTITEQLEEYKKVAIQKISETQIIKEYVHVDSAPIDDLLDKVAKELGLHPVVLQAIVLKESSGGNRNFLYRFEPGVYADRARVDGKLPEGERRMRASSHGITQVMGYVAESQCHIHWSELYDNYVALTCAGKILKENLLSVADIKNPATRLRTAYRMYNGSGPMAEAYATNIMGRIGELLFDKMFVESELKEANTLG